MYRIAQLSDLPAIAALWGQAFGDSPQTVADFFDAFPDCISYVAELDGTVVSMVHALPQALILPPSDEGGAPQGRRESSSCQSQQFACSCEGLPISLPQSASLTAPSSEGAKDAAYLYAVATDEAHRGRGLCRRLMAFAEDDLKRRGFACCTLTPGEPSLFDFYAKMGYESVFTRNRTVWDGVGTEIPPSEYALLRETLLTVPHISYDAPTLEYVQKAYGLAYYRTSVGCAAASPGYTAEVLPGDAGGPPFAMIKWLGDKIEIKDGFLGFPME